MKACSPSRIYPRKMAAHGAKYLLIAQGELQPLLPLHGGEDYECTHTHRGGRTLRSPTGSYMYVFGIEPRSAVVRPPTLSK